EELLAQRAAVGGQADQFQVVLAEHHQVVDRAHRVAPLRREREAQPGEERRRPVGLEAGVDDDVVDGQRGGHVAFPAGAEPVAYTPRPLASRRPSWSSTCASATENWRPALMTLPCTVRSPGAAARW